MLNPDEKSENDDKIAGERESEDGEKNLNDNIVDDSESTDKNEIPSDDKNTDATSTFDETIAEKVVEEHGDDGKQITTVFFEFMIFHQFKLP